MTLPNMNLSPGLDHLVVAATSLDEAADWAEAELGVRPQHGGKHLGFGSHNLLLRLGFDSYLELIAIDHDQGPPTRPRLFSLDEPSLQHQLLNQGPQLIHWVARAHDFDACAALIEAGRITRMARDRLTWRLTIPDDGKLRLQGALPSLIDWPSQDPNFTHPAKALPDQGLALVAFEVHVPPLPHMAQRWPQSAPPSPAQALQLALGLPDKAAYLHLVDAKAGQNHPSHCTGSRADHFNTMLIATLATPRGEVCLRSTVPVEACSSGVA